MKRTSLILILTFGIFYTSYCQKENDKNIFYVLNALGADLYENASFDSEVLEKIEVGKMIVATKVLESSQSKKIGDNFYLDGYFIRVNAKTSSGYIFSSDLTKFKPVLREIHKGITIPDIKGEKKNKTMAKRIVEYGNQEHEIEDEITEYENATYTYTAFGGCFDHLYLYRNLNLSEVYHQLTVHQVVINETEMKIQIPKFIKKERNEYHFEGLGATTNLKLIENEDGSFTVSSCDCT